MIVVPLLARDNIGSHLFRMENKMGSTVVYWDNIGDNGKHIGNYYGILGQLSGEWKIAWKLHETTIGASSVRFRAQRL